MGNLPEDFIFSQSSLEDYVACARRFELRYLQRLRYPAPEVDEMLAFERKMEQGERFHQLVQQHTLGIPSEILLKRIQDDELGTWFESYLKTALGDLPEKRIPERLLAVPLGDFSVLAKFDLLAIGEKFIIVDWKTSRKMPQRDYLAKRMQTLVYPYVLARGGMSLNGGKAIAPEAIEMRYVYIALGKTLGFAYSAAQMQQDEATLLQLLEEIDKRETFPLTNDMRRCQFCSYRSLCERGIRAGSLAELEESDDFEQEQDSFDFDIEQIAEIEF